MTAIPHKPRTIQHQTIISICLITAVSLFAYANSFQTPFTLDDYEIIINNPQLKIHDLSLAKLQEAATQNLLSCRWLPNISFALNYYFSGHAVWSYHLVNLLVHILAGFAMYLLFATTLNLPLFAGRWQRTGEIALAAALLWAAHPLQTNAVTYIVQRMTSMAALFYLCSLLFYVKARLQNSNRKRYALYAASLLAGLMALASKENAVMLPLLILTYEFFFLRDPEKPINYRKLAAITAAVVVTVTIIGLLYLNGDPLQSIFSGYKLRNFTMTERLLTEARVIFHYLSLIALPLPSRLNFNYDFQISTSLLTPISTLASVAGIVGLVLLIPILYKHDRLAAFAILWFLANLAVESTVIPLEIIFEHRLYLPSAFIFLAAAALLYRLCHAKTIFARTTVLVLVGILTVFTWQRNTVWATEISLWSDVVKKSPNLARAYNFLGFAYLKTGQFLKAEQLFRQAVDLGTTDGPTFFNLGNLYLKQNRPEQALPLLKKAVMSPSVKSSTVHSALGEAYLKMKDYDNAIKHAAQALRTDPDLIDPHLVLGIGYNETNRSRDALLHFKTAREKGLLSAALYNNWAKACFKLGSLDESIKYLKMALAIEPDNPGIHLNLGSVYERQGLLTAAQQEKDLAQQLQVKK